MRADPPMTTGADAGEDVRILVAEDDGAMRRMVCDTLVADGYSVTEVPDGGRLLVLLARCCREEEKLPDLILSDVRMPVMSGLGMLKGLRDARWTLPVVLMTAFPDPDTLWRARALDATVIAKPFPMAVLRDVVRQRLARGSTPGGDAP